MQTTATVQKNPFSRVVAGLQARPESLPARRLLRCRIGRSSLAAQAAWLVGVCLVLAQPTLVNLDPLLWATILLAITTVSFLGRQWWWIFLALGWAAANTQFVSHRQALLADFLERKDIQVTGRVIGLPESDATRTKFDFWIDDAETPRNGVDDAFQQLRGSKIRLSCYRCSQSFSAGEVWRFTVRLKRPNGFASWGSFDYEKYLFRHRIIATGYIRTKQPLTYLGHRFGLVDRWRERLRDSLTEQAKEGSGLGIFAALAIGDRSLLTQDHQETLRATGVSHLIAISGLHVGLVFILVAKLSALLLWPFARVYNRFPRPWICMPISLMAAIAYSAMAGFAISTQRALLMLTVYVLCRLLARDLSLLRVLILAASALLVWDPFSILDAGFWLSCYAVLVIALVSRKDGDMPLWKLQPWLWLGMLPMTVLFFGQVSLVSPLVNLVVVPVFCLILIPAVLLTVAGMGFDLTLVREVLLPMLVSVLDAVYAALSWVADLSIATHYPPATSISVSLFLLAAMTASMRLPRLLPALFIILLWAFWPRTETLQANQFRVTLLDVGQGLSMVVEAENYVLLYDTGPSYPSGFSTAQAVVIPYLRYRGITKIDHLIISHADSDHIGGLLPVLDTIPVQRVSTSRLDKMPSHVQRRSQSCLAGQRWQVADIDFQIISPDQGTPDGSNNRSCVLAISNGATRVLITGDIEKPVERYLLGHTPEQLPADILLVPHQGSKSSSTESFLAQVKPRYAWVAAGYKNHYGHPHPEVVQRYLIRGTGFISTVDAGSISALITGAQIDQTSFRESEPRFWRR